jgi:hypothetical protein
LRQISGSLSYGFISSVADYSDQARAGRMLLRPSQCGRVELEHYDGVLLAKKP